MSYISLSGNIAVGKSTVLYELEERGYEVVCENLGQRFLSLLDAYNKSPQEAIHLQKYINEYRWTDARLSCVGEDDGLYIHERSMIDDMIFTTYMICKGEISQKEGQEFLELATHRLTIDPPTKVIYLYADPDITFERMLERGRPEESSQTLLNIAELEQAHQVLLPIICGELGIELVEVNWSFFGEIQTILDLIE